MFLTCIETWDQLLETLIVEQLLTKPQSSDKEEFQLPTGDLSFAIKTWLKYHLGPGFNKWKVLVSFEICICK